MLPFATLTTEAPVQFEGINQTPLTVAVPLNLGSTTNVSPLVLGSIGQSDTLKREQGVTQKLAKPDATDYDISCSECNQMGLSGKTLDDGVVLEKILQSGRVRTLADFYEISVKDLMNFL